MSHHGNGKGPIPDEMRSKLAALCTELGATGVFPEGKLSPDDEGGIQFAIGVRDGKVCLDFGKPVSWLGMNPEDALKLAGSLIEKARKAAKNQGSILTLNL